MNALPPCCPSSARAALASLGLLLALGTPACGDADGGGAPAAVSSSGDQAIEPEALAAYAGVGSPGVNVLLISLDSVRRDYVSCYGYRPKHAPGQKTTPHLDALAAEGVLFEDYYASSSQTLQAYAAMMTGQPDLLHGVDTDFFAVDESRPMLAAVLEKVGYQTAGFYSNPELEDRFGFDRGFGEYVACYPDKLAELGRSRAALQAEIDAAMQADDTTAAGMVRQRGRLDRRMSLLADVGSSARQVTDHAIGAIERAEKGQRPWFVFAQYHDPHHDYDPPGEYARRFDPDYAGKIDGNQYFQNQAVGAPGQDPNPMRRKRVASDRDLEHLQALYAGEIAWTDAQVGRLIETLRSKGLLDKTLVIVTADHGVEFFEHGGIAGGGSLFEEQLRVPLVMRLPAALPAGKRVPGLVSHPDLMPTILELLGLPLPEGLASSSAVGLIDGSASGDDRYVLARLVQSHPRTSVGGPPITRHTVQEAFLQGPIKIMRWRRWPEAMPGLAIDKVDSVEQRAAAGRRDDFLLTWADLTEQADEAFADRNKDFAADPRAAAALARFRQIYAELLAQSRPVSASMGHKALSVARARPGFDDMMAKRRAEFQLTPPGQ